MRFCNAWSWTRGPSGSLQTLILIIYYNNLLFVPGPSGWASPAPLGSFQQRLKIYLRFYDSMSSFPFPPSYHLVLAPFVLQAETSEKICVHVTQLNKSVTVNITLENLAETRTSHVVSKTHPFQCIPFQVPRLSNSPEASEATLTVEVAVEVDIGLLVAHERQQVLVRNPESLVFVQTDKPIYKPGQEVRFRIMSVDEDFRPLNETAASADLHKARNSNMHAHEGVGTGSF
uniref:Macroglobulin domain-containing protein n=1 Tax=Podarcis muralis TaxID=64176 RepID=A0A670HLL8_PODMU